MPGERLGEQIIPAAEWLSTLKPLLDSGLSLKLSPSGLSMYPFLVGGRDAVMLRSAALKSPVRGDIVLFSRNDGIHVLHRVHHVRNNIFYMLGDAQTWIEGPVDRENVHAVAEAIVRKNRQISCSNPWLRFLVSVWFLLRPVRPVIIRSYLLSATLRQKFKNAGS